MDSINMMTDLEMDPDDPCVGEIRAVIRMCRDWHASSGKRACGIENLLADQDFYLLEVLISLMPEEIQDDYREAEVAIVAYTEARCNGDVVVRPPRDNEGVESTLTHALMTM